MSSYGKRLADVNEAIELVKFPLYYYKREWNFDGGSNYYVQINNWDDVFEFFQLNKRDKNISIDFHPKWKSNEYDIYLMIGKTEDISLYKLTEINKWEMFRFKKIEHHRNGIKSGTIIEYCWRKKS